MSKVVLVGKIVEAMSVKKDVPFNDIVVGTGIDRRQLSTLLTQLVKNGTVLKTARGYTLIRSEQISRIA